jgi:hypothetical protein
MSKIFGIGLSRTATTSLTLALEILGYRSWHFPSDETTQAEISKFLNSSENSLRLTALHSYKGLTDTPICCVYKGLDKGYQGSKFILTVREKESWLNSCCEYWKSGLLRDLDGTPDVSYRTFINFINKHLYGVTHFDPAVFSLVYDNYVDSVLKYFSGRPDDLLVIDICAGDGWDKLCIFLNVKNIPEFEFPWENGLTR